MERNHIRGRIEELEDRLVLSPMIAPIGEITLPQGQTIQVALDGSDTVAGATITYSFASSNSSVTTALAPTTNRSVSFDIIRQESPTPTNLGRVTFQFFDDLTPIATNRIITLINQGFYNNLTFHRITDLDSAAGTSSFIAQGGDPLGNGTGGSGVNFDDEFNVGLTFNGSGQLAMANAGDDDNDSQFFITDVNSSVATGATRRPPRFLNFNHTIFGQLTEGVNAIMQLMATPVINGSDPNPDVTMSNFMVFTDTQNGVLRISAPANFTGMSTITVTATSSAGGTVTQTFNVNVVPDTSDSTATGTMVNDRPFLGTIPPQATTPGTSTSFQIPATDLENNPLTFAVGGQHNFLNGGLTTNQPANATVSLTAAGLLTVTPDANLNNAIGLVSVGLAAGNDGTGLVAAMPATNLSGGSDSPPTAATLTTSLAGTNNDLTFTAQTDGAAGNNITIQYSIGAANSPLSLSVTGNAITVNLATDALGQPTSTANDVLNAFRQIRLRVGVRDNDTTRGTGITAFDTQNIFVTVDINMAPVADDQTATVFRNTNNRITLTGDDGDAVAVQTLTFRITALATNGRLLQSDGTTVISTVPTNLTSDVVFYRPNDGYTGPDSFMFTVMDNGGTVGGGQNTDPTPATVTLNVITAPANPMITLMGGLLRVRGGAESNEISIDLNEAGDRILVTRDGDPVQDFLLADVRAIDVRSEEGDDTVTVAEDIEVPSHLSGGLGDDELTGGAGDDLIRGGDGDDVLDGGDGDDIMLGGFGDDDMTGGVGNDLMRGGPAGLRDLQHGTPADLDDDKTDDDVMDGEEGDDTMFGGMGANELNGGDGNDVLFGAVRRRDPFDIVFQDGDFLDDIGDNTLSGGDGDDRMWGSFGDDELDGGDGNDQSHAGRGADMLIGSAGLDVFWAGRGIDEFDLTADEEFDDLLRDANRRREIVVGSFRDLRLLGIRQDLLPGAPPNPEPAVHQTGDIDYAALGYPAEQPPTFGPHHPPDSNDTDMDPGETPRTTGVYTTEQPDEDLVHNLEHGHVWISYDPAQLTAKEIARLERIVRSFERSGGVILTPRADNDDARPIALASWARILQFESAHEAVIREFVRTNRGHSPEGFIPMGHDDQ